MLALKVRFPCPRALPSFSIQPRILFGSLEAACHLSLSLDPSTRTDSTFWDVGCPIILETRFPTFIGMYQQYAVQIIIVIVLMDGIGFGRKLLVLAKFKVHQGKGSVENF
ncbi:hypothetical protein KQX54_016070 [Cotesia glomerata]|uniref:Uncharacterized protein n=1 Tax=Cotesia glomerata TaxID=32391 RepID=A0AAV7I6H2_COTGL|nr:hypothetical protein KQX54_016070 [Cotesia glomerata]